MEEVYTNKFLKNPFHIPQSNLYEFSGNVKTYVGYNIKGFNLLLDIPWSIVFIGIQFFFNFWLGIYALMALFILSGIVFFDFVKTQNIKKDENTSTGWDVEYGYIRVNNNNELLRAQYFNWEILFKPLSFFAK